MKNTLKEFEKTDKLLLRNACIQEQGIVNQLIDQVQLMYEAEPNQFYIIQIKQISRSILFCKKGKLLWIQDLPKNLIMKSLTSRSTKSYVCQYISKELSCPNHVIVYCYINNRKKETKRVHGSSKSFKRLKAYNITCNLCSSVFVAFELLNHIFMISKEDKM